MAYVICKKGKPVMYQVGEREWVCKSKHHTATGVTSRGAYTLWKNMVAWDELHEKEQHRLIASIPKLRLLG